MGYEYKGAVAEIGQVKQISDNFSIQTLVLSQQATKKDGEQFTKNALFEFSNTTLLSGIKVGDTVTVSFDLEARKHKEVWYGKSRAWKIVVEGGAKQGGGSEFDNTPSKQNPVMDDTSEDLPF